MVVTWAVPWTVAGLVVTWLSGNGSLQFLVWDLVVVIGFPGDDRRLVKIEGGRRRRGLPLQTRGVPRIGFGDRPVAQRPQEVDHGQKIADRENAGAGGRKHVQHLELRRILPVTARHANVAKNKLREERQIEAGEHQEG